TNAQGCSDSSDVTSVIVHALPEAVIDPAGTQTICSGESIVLSASPGASHQWNNGATTATILVSIDGKYSVTISDVNGCMNTSDTTTVIVAESPEATITADNPTAFCEGDSVTLTASDGASYLWSTGATTGEITVSTSGDYTVAVTNADGCSDTSNITSVLVRPLPEAAITPDGPTTFCEGGSVSLAASDASSFLWNTNATTPVITVTAAGNYSVTVTDVNGCSAISEATSVTVKSLPEITAEDVGRCNAGTVTLTASGTGTKSWFTTATGGTAVGTGDIFTTPSLSATTTYYVESELDGCLTPERESVEAIVTILAKPVITANNTNPEQPVLTSSASSGNQWFHDGTQIAGATGQTLAVSEEGMYTVQVTADGCTSALSDPYEYVLTGLEGFPTGGIAIYPNPAVDKLTIVLSAAGAREKNAVVVTDLMGRTMFERIGVGSVFELDLATLKPGKYFVLIRHQKKSISKKFVKE
ncbi:MAG TPA: T9SS type A sorting domain-containing protein, partial [Chryseosolibacter sp.]|nr:T9SS type A sorting domain-containing protein [Chryseosolibacter sp.]